MSWAGQEGRRRGSGEGHGDFWHPQDGQDGACAYIVGSVAAKVTITVLYSLPGEQEIASRYSSSDSQCWYLIAAFLKVQMLLGPASIRMVYNHPADAGILTVRNQGGIVSARIQEHGRRSEKRGLQSEHLTICDSCDMGDARQSQHKEEGKEVGESDGCGAGIRRRVMQHIRVQCRSTHRFQVP